MPRQPRADGRRRDDRRRRRPAGVSLSTVSRALNGNTTVDPALAERVKDAAAALDYTASPLARSLVLGRTQTVAVVVPDLGNPTFQAILRGLSRAAAADDYHVLIADSAESVDEERVLAVETRRRTDGVILCAPRLPAGRARPARRRARARSCSSTATPATTCRRSRADYRGALGELLAHLYALGHRRIVYLAGRRPQRRRTPPASRRSPRSRRARRRRGRRAAVRRRLRQPARPRHPRCSHPARPPCSPSTISWRWAC